MRKIIIPLLLIIFFLFFNKAYANGNTIEKVYIELGIGDSNMLEIEGYRKLSGEVDFMREGNYLVKYINDDNELKTVEYIIVQEVENGYNEVEFIESKKINLPTDYQMVGIEYITNNDFYIICNYQNPLDIEQDHEMASVLYYENNLLKWKYHYNNYSRVDSFCLLYDAIVILTENYNIDNNYIRTASVIVINKDKIATIKEYSEEGSINPIGIVSLNENIYMAYRKSTSEFNLYKLNIDLNELSKKTIIDDNILYISSMKTNFDTICLLCTYNVKPYTGKNNNSVVYYDESLNKFSEQEITSSSNLASEYYVSPYFTALIYETTLYEGPKVIKKSSNNFSSSLLNITGNLKVICSLQNSLYLLNYNNELIKGIIKVDESGDVFYYEYEYVHNGTIFINEFNNEKYITINNGKKIEVIKIHLFEKNTKSYETSYQEIKQNNIIVDFNFVTKKLYNKKSSSKFGLYKDVFVYEDGNVRYFLYDTIYTKLVTNVIENEIYQKSHTITFNGDGILNDKEIKSPYVLNDIGSYLLIIKGENGLTHSVSFTISELLTYPIEQESFSIECKMKINNSTIEDNYDTIEAMDIVFDSDYKIYFVIFAVICLFMIVINMKKRRT